MVASAQRLGKHSLDNSPTAGEGWSMVAANQVISIGRVQDWINTVINPALDGLRREFRFLPDGPWRWQPNTRSFEFFLPAKAYVPHPYGDNYDDFVEKYDDVREAFAVHDRLLSAFAKELESGFDVLSIDRGAFKNELDICFAGGDGSVTLQNSRDWFVSYVAGNFKRLPDYYVGHEVYNACADQLLATGRSVLTQAKIDVGRKARDLAEHDQKLEKQLVGVRRDLADRYGARVRPS